MIRELLIQLQDGSSRTLTLDNRRITLGRAADCDLAYPDDPVLSRRHVAIDTDGVEWFVEDLGSKNGTMVNGLRVNTRTVLRLGDRIAAGRVTLVYDDPALAADKTVVFVPEDMETPPPASVSTSLEQVAGSSADALEAALKSPFIAGTPRVQALLDAGRELAGHRPLSELFKVILDLAANSVNAQRGLVLTLEEGQLVPRAAKGDHFRISRPVRDRVIDSKESLLILDASQDESLRGSMTIVQQRVKSLMAVPLQTQDKVIGLIYVDSPDFIRPFTHEDLTLLTVMANIAAIRIENSRLTDVEEKEKLLKKELEQAAEIQRNLLPKEAPLVPGLDLAGYSAACRSVGGDYFDYLKLADGRVAVIVGDVAGKGMSAALLMSSLQARVQVLSEDAADLASLMGRLNRSVCSTCPGNRFITFFICIYDPPSGDFWFSNAGHNPPYIIRANGSVETLEAGGTPFGIVKAMTYRAERRALNPGDILVMFSDGVTEARSASDDEYGEDRLLDELKKRSGQSASEIVSGIHESLEQFMGEAPAADDITLVVARRLSFHDILN